MKKLYIGLAIFTVAVIAFAQQVTDFNGQMLRLRSQSSLRFDPSCYIADEDNLWNLTYAELAYLGTNPAISGLSGAITISDVTNVTVNGHLTAYGLWGGVGELPNSVVTLTTNANGGAVSFENSGGGPWYLGAFGSYGALGIQDASGNPYTNTFDPVQLLTVAGGDQRYIGITNAIIVGALPTPATNESPIVAWTNDLHQQQLFAVSRKRSMAPTLTRDDVEYTNIATYTPAAGPPAPTLGEAPLYGGTNYAGQTRLVSVANDGTLAPMMTEKDGPAYVVDLDALRSYAGSNLVVVVTDTNRGGLFTYTATAHATNAGTIYEAADGGRWMRNESHQSTWKPEWFGAVRGTDTTPTEDSAPAIQATIDALWSQYKGGVVQLSAGTYSLKSRIVMTNNYQMIELSGAPYSRQSGGFMSKTMLACYDPSSTNMIYCTSYGMFRNLYFRKLDTNDFGCVFLGRDSGPNQANRYSYIESCNFYGWYWSSNYPALKIDQIYGARVRDTSWSACGFCFEVGGPGVDSWFTDVVFQNCKVDSTSTSVSALFPTDDHGPYFANIEADGNYYGFYWDGGLVQSCKQGIRFKGTRRSQLKDIIGESWDPTAYALLLDDTMGFTLDNVTVGTCPYALILTNVAGVHTFRGLGAVATNGVVMAPDAVAQGAPLVFDECEIYGSTTNWFRLDTNVSANIYPVVIKQKNVTRILDRYGYDTLSTGGATYAMNLSRPSRFGDDVYIDGTTNNSATAAWEPAQIILNTSSNYVYGPSNKRMMRGATNTSSASVVHTTLIGQSGQVDFAYSNGTTESDPVARFELVNGQLIMAPIGYRSARTFVSPLTNSVGHPIAFAYTIDPYYRSNTTYSNLFGIGPARTVAANGTGANWWVSAGSASTNITGGGNINGGALLLSSGISVGSGRSDIRLLTATPSSGTTENTPNVKAVIDGNGGVWLDTVPTVPSAPDTGMAALYAADDGSGLNARIWSKTENGTTGMLLLSSGDTMSGTLTVTGLTNSALTASKIVLSAADKSLTSSTLAEADILTETEASALYQSTNTAVLLTGSTMTGSLIVSNAAGSTFTLTATNWVDSMVPGMSFRNGSSAPTLGDGPDSGVQILRFAKDAANLVHGSLQLNHNYKEGSDIVPHIHVWYPTYAASGAETNVWKLTYSWGNISTNGFPATSSISVTNTGVIQPNEHRIIPFGTLSGSGKKVSSVLLVSIERTGTDGHDVYDDVIGFAGFDVHYQVDTIGSASETAK